MTKPRPARPFVGQVRRGVDRRGTHVVHLFPSPKSQSVSCSIVSYSLRPHGLQLTRLLCSWDSPGKNTGMDCHSLVLGIFLTQGSNLDLLHFRQILYHLSHQGSSQPPANSIRICDTELSLKNGDDKSNVCGVIVLPLLTLLFHTGILLWVGKKSFKGRKIKNNKTEFS